MNQSLRELWDSIDAGPPPLTDVRAGSGRVRRRRRWVTTGSAAAVLAVVAGGLGAQELGADDQGTDVASTSLPAAPDGLRWVGLGRVVVAVPDWWTTGETQCLAPVEDTVYFDQAAVAECSDPAPPAAVREVSALAVFDGKSGYGEAMLREMEPVSEVAGREVVEREGCEEWFPGVCRRFFGVPDEGVVFAVTIADERDGSYEAIRDSVQVLPDGLATVPLAVPAGFTPGRGSERDITDDLVAAIEAAGLDAQVETVDTPPGDTGLSADFRPGTLLEVSPSLGSVIEVGGTVTVRVSG